MDLNPETPSSPSSSSFSELFLEDLSTMASGSPDFGCVHYRRKCKIRSPCCDAVFSCRHCHNEAKNSLQISSVDQHDIPRHKITKVICSLCQTEQDVRQHCINCGVCMGNYFCPVCKFYDDDVSKRQYHCEECGICRTGGRENFFHCRTCECCYPMMMKDAHRCIERAMHHNCPVCFEFLFDTTRDVTVLPCGHTLHLDCVREMGLHCQYSCPICSKSIRDMSCLWSKFDQMISSTPMPQMYQNKKVWILCNDCGSNSQVFFHILGHKCCNCMSYNTKQTRTGPASAPCSPEIAGVTTS